MFDTFEEAQYFVDRQHIQEIDLKFCDLWGRWHHLSVPASQFTPTLMEQGIGFDGSAVGLKSVKAGDMVLVPDLSTGTLDPFWNVATLSFICTTLEADTVIVSIGQQADLSFAAELGVSIHSNGGLETDPVTLETSLEGVFAGGDVVHGAGSVAQAIGAGREAARSIDRYLSGRDLRLGRLGRDKVLRAITEPQKEIFDPASRTQMPHIDPDTRIQSFDEVQTGFTEAMTVQEGNRCIMCGASCVQSCPYDVMQFNPENYKAVKCDLCIDKRSRGEAPACTTVCPTKCIYWGDPEIFPNGFKKLV